jgi:hypothetical protein
LGITLWGLRVRIRIGEAELSRSPARCQLLSADLDEGRHARRIDAETLSYEVLIGTQLLQTKADPIGPREVIDVPRLHRSKVPDTEDATLSIRY